MTRAKLGSDGASPYPEPRSISANLTERVPTAAGRNKDLAMIRVGTNDFVCLIPPEKVSSLVWTSVLEAHEPAYSIRAAI